MALATIVRFTVGTLFVCSGCVKITRLGNAVVPDMHKNMAKDYAKYLRAAPFKGYFKVTSSQYMHFVGYSELLGGMLLLTNNATVYAALVLALVKVAATHTHYKVKDPYDRIVLHACMACACLYVAWFAKGRKMKKSD